MLSMRRCPHTGVINVFAADDLHLPVGSIFKGARVGYIWLYHSDPCMTGCEPNLKDAERRLAEVCAAEALRNAPPLVDAA
jgi:hypothetical protein